jgi:hypothetical protein
VAGRVDRGLDAFLMLHGQSSFVENNTGLILAFQKACGISLESESTRDSEESSEREGRARPFHR